MRLEPKRGLRMCQGNLEGKPSQASLQVDS